MTQPLGNCPGCGADEPFEQVHAGECPDVGGECPEWACVGCGAGVVMGTLITGTLTTGTLITGTVTGAEVSVEQSVRAA